MGVMPDCQAEKAENPRCGAARGGVVQPGCEGGKKAGDPALCGRETRRRAASRGVLTNRADR